MEREAEIVTFVRRGKRYWFLRDKKTKRFIKRLVWRYSYGVTYVHHSVYYSTVGQAWSEEKRDDIAEQVRDEVNDEVYSYCNGYDPNEWYGLVVDCDEWTLVPYDREVRKLIEKMEIRVETKEEREWKVIKRLREKVSKLRRWIF